MFEKVETPTVLQRIEKDVSLIRRSIICDSRESLELSPLVKHENLNKE
jgi:hypothetical protein